MNTHINKTPKFNVGDWITDGNITIRIDAIKNDCYLYCGDCALYSIQTADKVYHLWTINDAKEGDVLSYETDEEDLWIMIYWSLYEPYEGHVHYHALLVNDEFYDKGTCCICINDLKPATKKQRNLLFQKMKESEYEWDAEKKELKKIEQKPADRVEPKFNVGNWYQCTKDFFGKGVTFDKDTAYYCAKEGCLQDEYGCHIAIVKDLYDNFKLWTIQDAKPGDVLVDEDNNIGIYKEIEDNWWNSYIYLGCNNCLYGPGIGGIGGTHGQNSIKPATKEQCDLLFSKMKEAGYEWDVDKKEFKKIEQKSWSDGNKKLTDVNHEYFSKLLENDDSKDINYYAYQVAYCMSHDWAKDNATWEDIQQACKLGALWQQKQDQQNLKKRTEEEFKSLFKKHYENGRKSMKGELLKHYISSDVFDNDKQLYTTETWDDMDALLKSINAKSGDKVKIIIVK